ncbi:Mannose-P-dolichol utilization defect 1 protein-like protein [Picochlorum sp. SENEW3]|nr:Mannose-P-dolichol utilization defect 1 protein-like protein [Picochlorum sp. SENEW3]
MMAGTNMVQTWHGGALGQGFGAMRRRCRMPLVSHDVHLNIGAWKDSQVHPSRHCLSHSPRLTCHSSLVSSPILGSIADAASLKTVTAVIVGWLVIAGSSVRSLPQILRIMRNKSVEGLSAVSFGSELMAFMITIAYNVRFMYPLSTWGETLTNGIQHAVLVGMIFFYNKDIKRQSKILTVLGMVAGVSFLFSHGCSDAILRWLQSLVIVILAVFGRIPQIVLNLRRGNSGELSFMSTFLSVLGNVARVFTTWALVNDGIIMATAISQLILNSILLGQILDTMKQERVIHA